MVLDEDRGSLPFTLIHGEALVACAAWALGEAGVDIVDATVVWEAVTEAGEDFVLHDSLCPMTPPDFIAACIEQARSSGHAVVGVRPVTDTVKALSDGLVGDTLDRDSLLAVTSPLVVPAGVVVALARRPVSDLAQAVADLAAAGHPVETLPAPTEGRRVTSADDVRLLGTLTDARG
ncbi:2-C-methyl-D-erythritol 4-phosphate cytidylyltransferase [Nocardia sp. N13]|uniref:2-C-methyl-D-erythritol 4-phosphate cytidylyltransferase n=1 Tax=Nocardioides sp. N13(2025) TaxID=3453405 RepID=UPI003F7686CD